MADIMDSPTLIRNVTLCGHMHHGKVLTNKQSFASSSSFIIHFNQSVFVALFSGAV